MDSSVPDPVAVPRGLRVHVTEQACINPDFLAIFQLNNSFFSQSNFLLHFQLGIKIIFIFLSYVVLLYCDVL